MNKVAIVQTKAEYPTSSPYNPSENYPEYIFKTLSDQENLVYDKVRELFFLLGYDASNFGKAEWNPLGYLIKPGMNVVLKPNLVLDFHKDKKDIYSIITHPSVLRAIVDYCCIALKGLGTVIIADAPQYNCNFENLVTITGLDKVIEFYKNSTNIKISILDLRKYWSKGKHFSSLEIPLTGDPKGDIIEDAGRKSLFSSKENLKKLYGAKYNRKETILHQNNTIHEYQISQTILNADVFISVPKLKVHKKVGVTLNAKGLVGISTNKNFLPHYTLGSSKIKGDQYPNNTFTFGEKILIDLERWMYDHLLSSGNKYLEYIHRTIYWIHNHTTYRLGIKVDPHKRILDAGNWYGNDTCWRMVADLTNIFYSKKIKTLSIIDGIIAGENNGPLSPDPKYCGTLLAGKDLLSVDMIAISLMGFDYKKMKLYKYFSENYNLKTKLVFKNKLNLFNFIPHPGWENHIEFEE